MFSGNEGALLKDVMVTRMEDQTKHRLGDFWEKSPNPVVLLLMRRWGCMLCRMGAANVTALRPLTDPAGVQIIGVGLETFGYDDFAKARYFSGPLFVDEGQNAFKALGMRRNSLWDWRSQSILDWARFAKARGFTGNLKGDGNQLGGTFVLEGRTGRTLYSHYQRTDDFEPDVRKILDVLGIAPPPGFEPYPNYVPPTADS